MGLSLIPQPHGGALLSGGKPGNPGHNQHTVRQRAQELRGQLIGAPARAPTPVETAVRPIPPQVLQEHGGVDHLGLGLGLGNECDDVHHATATGTLDLVDLEEAPPCFCGIAE